MCPMPRQLSQMSSTATASMASIPAPMVKPCIRFAFSISALERSRKPPVTVLPSSSISGGMSPSSSHTAHASSIAARNVDCGMDAKSLVVTSPRCSGKPASTTACSDSDGSSCAGCASPSTESSIKLPIRAAASARSTWSTLCSSRPRSMPWADAPLRASRVGADLGMCPSRTAARHSLWKCVTTAAELRALGAPPGAGKRRCGGAASSSVRASLAKSLDEAAMLRSIFSAFCVSSKRFAGSTIIALSASRMDERSMMEFSVAPTSLLMERSRHACSCTSISSWSGATFIRVSRYT